jgi:hypothetical protein
MALDIVLCRRCQARIRWAFTPAGRRMPLDADPDPEGNVYWGPTPEDPHRLARVDRDLVAAALTGQLSGDVYMPHHATCGNPPPRGPRQPRPPKPTPPSPQLGLDLGQ